MKIRYFLVSYIDARYAINEEQACSSTVIEIIKSNCLRKFEKASRECPFHGHVRDTRASLAGTIPNVTILWGSWHWAVSGPIGPNLPVFHYPESRPNPILPSRELKGRRGEDYDSFSSPLARSANGERERENPSVSSRSADRGSMKAERARAREHKEIVQTKTQKRESLDPTFRAMPAILVPSDHRCGST